MARSVPDTTEAFLIGLTNASPSMLTLAECSTAVPISFDATHVYSPLSSTRASTTYIISEYQHEPNFYTAFIRTPQYSNKTFHSPYVTIAIGFIISTCKTASVS